MNLLKRGYRWSIRLQGVVSGHQQRWRYQWSFGCKRWLAKKLRTRLTSRHLFTVWEDSGWLALIETKPGKQTDRSSGGGDVAVAAGPDNHWERRGRANGTAVIFLSIHSRYARLVLRPGRQQHWPSHSSDRLRFRRPVLGQLSLYWFGPSRT